MSRRLIESRVVFEGRVFKVVRDVLLVGGRRVTRDVVVHRGAVAFLPENDRGEVILVYQYRHSVGRRLLEVPAGTLEEGEDPVECVKREALEEIGYEAEDVEYLGEAYVAPGYSSELIKLYHVRVARYVGARPEPGEDILLVRLGFRDLLSRVLSGSITDGKTILTTLLTAYRKGLVRVV